MRPRSAKRSTASLRERLFGSRPSTAGVLAAMDERWRTYEQIVERAGYTPMTTIYSELLRLEQNDQVESKWLVTSIHTDYGVRPHQRRVYRRRSIH